MNVEDFSREADPRRSNGKRSTLVPRLCCFLLLPTIASGQVVRQISLNGLGDAEPVVIALNGKGVACDEAVVLDSPPSWRSGPVSIENRVEEPCRRCAEKHLRLAVFSADNAAVYVGADEVCERGTDGTVSIDMRPLTSVKVNVWYTPADFRLKAMDAIANANWVFRRNMVGFRLDAVFRQRPAGFPEDASDFCAAAPQSAAYVRGEMNIYFPWRPSETCGAEGPGQTPNIISIGGPAPLLGDVPHELGHAFGLRTNDGDQSLRYCNGHTPPQLDCRSPDGTKANLVGGTPLFAGDNAIWSGSLVLGDTYRLGQVFWMNFSNQSLLAHVKKQNSELRQVLSCPNECVPYRLDTSDDRRPGPGANRRPFLVGESCPQDFTSRKNLEFLQSFFTGFALFTGIRGLDQRLDPIGSLDDVPRYCRAKDLMDTLDDRYPTVCLAPDLPVKCGSKSRKDFRETWSAFLVRSIPRVIAKSVSDDAAAAFMSRSATAGTCEESKECRAYLPLARNLVEEIVLSREARKLQGKRVLWVDEPGTNSFERRVLHAFRMETNSSATNAGALRQLRNEKFDLVISNFSRPNEPQAATDLLDQMKKARIKIPVIIYSRNVSSEDRSAAIQKGALEETDNVFELYRLVLKVFLKRDIPLTPPAELDPSSIPGRR